MGELVRWARGDSGSSRSRPSSGFCEPARWSSLFLIKEASVGESGDSTGLGGSTLRSTYAS